MWLINIFFPVYVGWRRRRRRSARKWRGTVCFVVEQQFAVTVSDKFNWSDCSSFQFDGWLDDNDKWCDGNDVDDDDDDNKVKENNHNVSL